MICGKIGMKLSIRTKTDSIRKPRVTIYQLVVMATKMFSNQGGKTLELFTAHGKDPLAKVKLTGGRTIKKEFDSYIKGYVLSLNGSPATSRVHLPKAERKGMGLIHSFLMLQIFLPQDSRTLIELTILDTTNCKQKLQFLSWQKDMSFSPLTVKLPLSILTNEWQWLIIDLAELVPHLLCSSYQSLETIDVCGSCKIRLIATLRDMITCNTDIPSSWQPPPSTPPLNFTVLNSEIFKGGSHKDGEERGVKAVNKHVAFGETIPIPQHIKVKSKPVSSEKRYDVPPSTGSNSLQTNEGLIPELSSQQRLIPELSSQQRLIPKPSSQQFTYVSPPHSTTTSPKAHTQTNKTQTQTNKTQTNTIQTTRRETLDDDFLSLSTATTTNNIQQDYNWTRYHDSDHDTSDSSSHHETPPITPLMDNKTTNRSLHDSIDTSEMGGPITPRDSAFFPLTDQSDASNDDKNLELLYDPDLNYFYDPNTGKCYELTH